MREAVAGEGGDVGVGVDEPLGRCGGGGAHHHRQAGLVRFLDPFGIALDHHELDMALGQSLGDQLADPAIADQDDMAEALTLEVRTLVAGRRLRPRRGTARVGAGARGRLIKCCCVLCVPIGPRAAAKSGLL